MSEKKIWQCNYCDFKGAYGEVQNHLMITLDSKHSKGFKNNMTERKLYTKEDLHFYTKDVFTPVGDQVMVQGVMNMFFDPKLFVGRRGMYSEWLIRVEDLIGADLEMLKDIEEF